MSDYMKEALRLLAEHEQAAGLCRYEDCQRTRAALLAHIQRGAVPEWGKLMPVESSLKLASLFRGAEEAALLSGYDHVDAFHCGYRALLAAAPAPDQFRDAAKMMADTEDNGFDLLHDRPHTEMPGCRGAKSLKVRAPADEPCDVVGHCVAETHCKTACKLRSSAPAEVLMPKPVAYGFGNTAITGHTNRLMMVRIDIPGGDQYAGAFWLPLVLADEAHTYGVACRAAGEAAGYARGRAEAGRDAERYRTVRFLATAERDPLPEYAGDTPSPDAFDASIDHATAALRGEVK